MQTEIELVESFRLSPQQRHLWELQRGNRSQPFRSQCGILIEGSLDVELLKAALTRLIERHEILRTTFQDSQESAAPVQVVRESSEPRMEVLDLSGYGPREQEDETESLFEEMGRWGFDFEQGPLLHLLVLRLAADRHLLMISLPALCADAATLGGLVQEISLCYEAGAAPRDVDEPMQYGDLSEWQNEMLEAEYAAAGREFWRRQASSLMQIARLPFEVYRAPSSEFVPCRFASTLDSHLLTQLELLAAKYDTSLGAVLNTCWRLLLRRVTGQIALTVSVADEGRAYEELKGTLGPLSKYVPVQTELDDSAGFAEALRQTERATAAAVKWQACFSWEQFSEINREAGPSFCHIAFEFERQPAKCFAAGLSFSLSRRYSCADRFKLKLSFFQREDALDAEFHYDANLIPAAHVELLAGQLRSLLESVVTDPEAAIGELEMLSEAEQAPVVGASDEAKRVRTGDRCVHRLFEEQAEKRPQEIALVFEEQRLTYAELNARANQLAHYLRACGVGPEARVGICLERSIEVIVAMLGVLKAGGAYVPLDATLPPERLSRMMEEAQAEVLLTERRFARAISGGCAQVVCLDSDQAAIAGQSAENPEGGATIENLVYVLFTSGSTGTPKGVGIEHRQLLNYLRAITGELEVGAGAAFALVSTFAADLGHTVIFPSLCNGGSLHVISQERVSDAAALADYFTRHRIDCVKIVPSHLSALLASSRPESVLPRRQLVLGGEASKWELIERIQLLAPDCAILNHYGPTETTVGVLTYKVEKQAQGHGRFSATVPLGRPLPNTEVHVLDARLRPVPTWATGELYIGGDGLARGYLNQPGLTAERFVPNPFSRVPGARLYRTGDLARRLPDGCLEFLGRNDHQVKIRGFRVELGEIEAALNRHPGVREAVVTVHQDASGEKRLVAYPVTVQAGSPSVNELRDYLKETLPAYMVPNAFVALKSIPLTPNGKIDRRALPPPDEASRREVEYVEPRDETESILIGAWERVLNVAPVGVHDDYFALGGDSIRVIQIVHEASRFNLSVTAADIFQYPTVHKLARHLREGGSAGRVDRPVPLELIRIPDAVRGSLPEDVEDVYPASKMQQLMLFHYEQDQQKMGVYHLQHSYHIHDDSLSVRAFKRALEIVVRAHSTLRTSFVFDRGPEPLQIVRKKLPLSIEEFDISDLCAEEQEQRIASEIEQDREKLFDVRKADEPLFRCAIFIRSEQSISFLLSMHHAISDGWGNRELITEMAETYRAIKRGEKSEKAGTGSEYKEFVALEREIIASEEARDFWTKHLARHSHEPLPRRPVTARPSSQTGYAGTLDAALAAKVHEASRSLRVSVKAILLGAYVNLLGNLTEHEQVTVGVVSNGRSERLSNALKAMGLFWNIIPFCCPAGSTDRAAHLRTVQQLLIDAEAYARYPLLQIMDDLRQTELFFATFNFLHFHNVKEIPSDSGLRLLGFSGHDKFHFPLNYALSVDPFSGVINFRVEHDRSYFSDDSVRLMTDKYIELLDTSLVL
jgi:amino acid adenylation domain-containing protein